MHKQYMRLCLELAVKGLGNVAPNPMVGCIIVHKGKIIGKGCHKEYGDWHAEVNAISSVKDKKLLPRSTLYVTLEPCNHYGKTPPCTKLIIHSGIKNVVIGSVDPNPLVSGKGMEALRKTGCKVAYGILDKENRELNKRFFTFHEKKRPYIMLKWAQTKDGFIDWKRTAGQPRARITNSSTNKLVHQWRSEEQAIMVGTNTALLDNPRLTVRYAKGKDPVRIVLDKELKIPKKYHLLDGKIPTIIFTSKNKKPGQNIDYITIDFGRDVLKQVLNELYKRSIQSMIVEGGAELLNSFIKAGLWDEARVIISPKQFKEGIPAPKLVSKPYKRALIKGDKIYFYRT